MKLWFQHENIWVCVPPKCAGTALYCALLGIDPALGRDVFSAALERTRFHSVSEVTEALWNRPAPAYLVMRDPVQRFASLWRDKCRDGDPNLPELRGLTPDGLATFVRDNLFADAHWAPQTAHLFCGATPVNYGRMLGWFAPRAAAINQTVHDDTPMPVARILTIYAADVAVLPP